VHADHPWPSRPSPRDPCKPRCSPAIGHPAQRPVLKPRAHISSCLNVPVPTGASACAHASLQLTVLPVTRSQPLKSLSVLQLSYPLSGNGGFSLSDIPRPLGVPLPWFERSRIHIPRCHLNSFSFRDKLLKRVLITKWAKQLHSFIPRAIHPSIHP
jgi:hypothetical protein